MSGTTKTFAIAAFAIILVACQGRARQEEGAPTPKPSTPPAEVAPPPTPPPPSATPPSGATTGEEGAPDAITETTTPEHATTGPLTEAEFKALHELRADAAPALHGAMIDVAGSKAYLSLPARKAPLPGLVLVHEWWGLNDHVKHWADRLAADGYAALAVDLYGGKVATTSDEAMALMKDLDQERSLDILKAAHRFLVQDQRVGALRTGSIGWCLGGHWSLRLAIAEPELDACVIYYGRPILEPEKLANVKAAVLGIFGSKDATIPGSTVKQFELALEKAGVTTEIFMFQAEHAFANPSGERYDEVNANKAWSEARRFLRHHVKLE